MSPGGAASGQKGAKYERELVNAAREAGWGAMRLPASGAGTTGDRADIMLGRPDELTRAGRSFPSSDLYLVEAKSGKGNRLYVDADEVEALKREAERWGATPLLGARSTTRRHDQGHYLVPPDACPTTPSEKYALVFENAGRTDDPLVYDEAVIIVWPGDDPEVEVRP